MKTLIIATGNTHKTGEFAQLLASLNYSVQSAAVCGGMPYVEENGSSFAANAELKAKALRAAAPAEAWILADDSGLEVDALNGAPGIYSARYAGEKASDKDNLEKLLAALSGVLEAKRTARFRCALCVIGPDGRSHFYEGSCKGYISLSPTGCTGFGYDPVFIPEGYSQSFAELGESVKDRLSHRAKAVAAFMAEA
ncbi:MAG: RdgB/HAM1 family non-canonical purine NTP pyrophosphatase [Verrucomicrobiota bacterium]